MGAVDPTTAQRSAARPGELEPPRLEVRHLSKSFRASRALADVSLEIAPGEIHGLVGENGSGKSTLIKILSGFHRPDGGGELLIDGRPLELPVRPAAMRKFGLSVVHQDLGLVESFSVVENMRVGLFGVRRFSRAIRWRQERELARASLAALGADVEPDTRVAELSAAERAEVAIARALQRHGRGRGLVMFDESTRALPREPRRRFHSLLREITAGGGSVLLVSHQLEEVLEYTDRVTVLRDGRVTASGVPVDELTEHQLIRLMLGRELTRASRRVSTGPTRAPAAEIRGLCGQVVTDLDLSVGAGEILGLTGLLGSGFEEASYLIAGDRRATAGTVSVAGRTLELPSASIPDLLDAGIALIPERRERDGLAFSETVVDNVTLPRLRTRGSAVHLGSAWRDEEAEWVLRELGLRPADPRMLVGQLSGGNQQKVLVGKWLCGDPKLLVLHEPTQGVDVGAREALERAIGRAAERGAAVILAGMDTGELAGMCDRVLVMRAGRVWQELTSPLPAEEIIDVVYGNGQRTPSP